MFKSIWESRKELLLAKKWLEHRASIDGWSWVAAHILTPAFVLALILALLASDPQLTSENLISAYPLNSVITADGTVSASSGLALVLQPDHPPFTVLDSLEPGKEITERRLLTSLSPEIASSHLTRLAFTRYGLEIDPTGNSKPTVLILDFTLKGTLTIGAKQLSLDLLEPPPRISIVMLLGPGLAVLFGFGYLSAQGRSVPEGQENLSSYKATDENEGNVIERDRQEHYSRLFVGPDPALNRPKVPRNSQKGDKPCNFETDD